VRVTERLVGIFVPYMASHELTQAALASRLGVHELDLLDMAWQRVPRDRDELTALARRYDADESVLAAILRTA